jgi:hypothetical protein
MRLISRENSVLPAWTNLPVHCRPLLNGGQVAGLIASTECDELVPAATVHNAALRCILAACGRAGVRRVADFRKRPGPDSPRDSCRTL